MNKVYLIGRLIREPEVRYSQSDDGQLAIARYTLAVDRRFRRDGDQQTADFIPCTAFGRQGEFAEKYLTKGMKIAVVGEWRTGSYTNKDGQKVYTNELFVSEHEFVESKGASESNRPAPQPTAVPDGDGFMNIPDGVEDEGLPFN